MTYPAELFGFAMSRGLIETARAALGSFQAGYNRSSLSTQPWLLSLVPFEDLARLPVEVILDLHRAQELVLLAESRWSTEAAKVKVRLTVHRAPEAEPLLTKAFAHLVSDQLT